MTSRMLSGTPILQGDSTIPGVKMHKELEPLIPIIHEKCKEMGLDYYPTIVELMRYDEISELAAYGGFPSRYPHWRWGMEYEELSRGYEHGMHRISEMVINNNPCYIYCMDSNPLVDNVDVIAHAIGHNDFFKNNVFFEKTNRKMMDKLANHGTRIRQYMARWGKEKVTEFIDHVLSIDTLINPAKAWKKTGIKKQNFRDEREYRFPDRLKATHGYMDDWVNTKEYKDEQRDKVTKRDAADFLELFGGPERDIMGYLKDHAPLKLWQQDIISMMYDESMYFAPQRQTKMLNEGWASYVDYHIMCREGLCGLGQKSDDCGIWQYAKHKMLVLGGKYSQNPYKLGFELFMDIEKRWDKGQFGPEWENCKNMHERENWDKKLGLGREKVFEIRKMYNDFTAIQEFFTPEFCEKNEFYEYKKLPNGEWKIVNRDFKSIKQKLLHKYLNGGLPDIRLMEPNHLGKGWMLLQHMHNGLPLYSPYAREAIVSLYRIWNNVIVLASKNKDGVEYVYVCDGVDIEKDVHIMSMEEYEKEFIK